MLSQSGLNIQFKDSFEYESIISQIQSDSESFYLLCIDDILAIDGSLDLLFTRLVRYFTVFIDRCNIN